MECEILNFHCNYFKFDTYNPKGNIFSHIRLTIKGGFFSKTVLNTKISNYTKIHIKILKQSV